MAGEKAGVVSKRSRSGRPRAKVCEASLVDSALGKFVELVLNARCGQGSEPCSGRRESTPHARAARDCTLAADEGLRCAGTKRSLRRGATSATYLRRLRTPPTRRKMTGLSVWYDPDCRPAAAIRTPWRNGLIVALSCQHCGRKFSQQAHERHVKHCGNTKARPKTLMRCASNVPPDLLFWVHWPQFDCREQGRRARRRPQAVSLAAVHCANAKTLASPRSIFIPSLAAPPGAAGAPGHMLAARRAPRPSAPVLHRRPTAQAAARRPPASRPRL